MQKALEIFVKYASNNLTRQTINSSISSYGLKHRVEELSKAIEKVDPSYSYEYIGNNDFIKAMREAGFISKVSTHNRLNYYFNLGKLDYKNKWLREMVELYRAEMMVSE